MMAPSAMRSLALATAAPALCAALVIFPGVARGTTPGRNGRIAFSQGFVLPGEDPAQASQVYTVVADGSRQRQLTHVPRGRAAASPAFSPRGDRIAYVSNVSGSFQVWVMDAAGRHQHALTHDRNRDDFEPSWAPDGRTIVFSRCVSPFGFIAACDIVRTAARGGPSHRLVGGASINQRPRFSPDGRRIVFSSDRGGLQSALWTMTPRGHGLRRITPARREAFWPDWSPDGRRILFTDQCCTPYSNVWTVRRDGSRARQLTHLPGHDLQAGFAAWSPDGRRIVFNDSTRCRAGVCFDFWIMRSDGTGRHRIVTHRRNTLLFDWGTFR